MKDIQIYCPRCNKYLGIVKENGVFDCKAKDVELNFTGKVIGRHTFVEVVCTCGGKDEFLK